MWPDWLRNISLSPSDPVVQKIIAGSAGLIVLVIVLRVIGRIRHGLADARLRALLRREKEESLSQQQELQRLSEQIVATSSTVRVAGYAIVRQVETVFSDGKTSSAGAVELLKALAAQKGANAVVNLQTRQTPGGKWAASGDAVVVRMIGRRGEEKT
jgi:hypothetical protein